MHFEPAILADAAGLVKETLARRIFFPTDTGPIYKETLMGRSPVEPWNTFSNIVFLLVVIYWSIRVFPQVRRHLFLAFTLPVLLVGFIGGTLYHAFRDEQIWLWMDWLPIVLLCLACAVLFARRGGLSWPRIGVLLTLPFLLRWSMGVLTNWSDTVILNLEYVVIGAIVLVTVLLHLRKRKWMGRATVTSAVVLFAVALMFRALDKHAIMSVLPMGSHWLWHLLGGAAVHFLVLYIHQDDVLLSLERKDERIPGPVAVSA